MSNSFSESAKANKLSLWIGVSLLWGTIFFLTSIFALGFVSEQRNGVSTFHPSIVDSIKAYSIYIVFVIGVAVSGFLFNRLYDPTGEKRNKRIADVTAGKKENYFVSFAGSLATGFVFGLLTALAFFLAQYLFGIAAEADVATVMLASLVNVGAGVAGSLATGIVFVVLKLLGKFPSGETA